MTVGIVVAWWGVDAFVGNPHLDYQASGAELHEPASLP
jgi:hypothetical protein